MDNILFVVTNLHLKDYYISILLLYILYILYLELFYYEVKCIYISYLSTFLPDWSNYNIFLTINQNLVQRRHRLDPDR